MAVSKPFKRPVSASERLYLAGLAVVPPVCLHLVVEGTGTLDEERLQRAVEAAAKENPGCRLILKGKGRDLSWKAQRAAPKVHVALRFNQVTNCRQATIGCLARLSPTLASACKHVVLDRPFGALETDLSHSDWLDEPIDPRQGPTCSVFLLPGPKVVFRAFHGVMDAQGVLNWMGDVFRALREEPLCGHDDDHTDSSLANLDGPRPVRPNLRPVAPCALVPKGTDLSQTSLLCRRLDGLPRLGIATIVAEMASFHQDLGETKNLRLMVPVDLRRRHPTIKSTGNLSLPLFLDVAVNATAEQINASVISQLSQQLECSVDPSEKWLDRFPPWAAATFIRAICTWGSKTGGFVATALVSHLGQISLADFSAPGFDASTLQSLPVAAGLVPLVVTVVELGDHVQIGVCAPDAPESHHKTNTLLDHIEAAARRSTPSRPADWNLTERPPPELPLYAAFREQARLRPQAIACHCGDTTYAELDYQALQFASLLLDRGVEAGERVAIALPRGPDLLPAWLGVLAHGAAIVPIDPGYPAARIERIVNHSGSRILISSMGHPHDFTGQICTVSDIPSSPISPADLPDVPLKSIATVMYTSGSTGLPKGVAVPHQALANYAIWAQAIYGIGPQTCFGCFTSPAFDLTITSTLVPLLAGGSVYMVEEDFGPLTPELILNTPQINALKLTPAHLSLLADSTSLATSSLELLVVGGAQLHVDLANRVQQSLPSARIINEYGPTECTVGCTHHQFDPHLDYPGTAVPIGQPGFNQRAHVTDSDGQPVPPGTPGELWIAGLGLARGYEGEKEETKSRFRSLPAQNEVRAYRTGDRVCFDRGGVLSFLGRVDRQLEIRGFRVEPAEVEASLERCRGVKEAAVTGLPHPNRRGGIVIGAWYVKGADTVSSDAILAQLSSQLPAPYLPSWLVEVTDWPLTQHGKVDFAALPRPEVTTPPDSVPLDEMESAIHQIWANSLHVDSQMLALDATLDELGGDSLVLVELFRRVQELAPHTDPEVLLTAIVSSSTIRSMTDQLRNLGVQWVL
ncbi:MAG: amino acid adenylation domain-containing protein [Proteobacteria bacterium]|nr:amino acid adenylation domain-containing protein [Pseudomonadota bacterium]